MRHFKEIVISFGFRIFDLDTNGPCVVRQKHQCNYLHYFPNLSALVFWGSLALSVFTFQSLISSMDRVPTSILIARKEVVFTSISYVVPTQPNSELDWLISKSPVKPPEVWFQTFCFNEYGTRNANRPGCTYRDVILNLNYFILHCWIALSSYFIAILSSRRSINTIVSHFG